MMISSEKNNTSDGRGISADYPFVSHYAHVHGSHMHFVDEGSGDPILFLHGNPTFSYLWRNIIPHLTSLGRCIAPDLMGMGRSDKLDLAYRFFDHVNYVEGFIAELDLKNITLVAHDWGSALGFHYAMRHKENIKGIAFMEAIVRPLMWQDLPADIRIAFKLMRTAGIGWLMIRLANIPIRQVLPRGTVRKLSAEERKQYAAPYKTIRSRRPIQQWLRDLPINGRPEDVTEAVAHYSRELQASPIPKLLFFGRPGGLIDDRMVAWCRQNLENLVVVDVGQGNHFLQEDNPHLIGLELANWYERLHNSAAKPS